MNLNFLEKAMFLSILKAYKEVVQQIDHAGGFDRVYGNQMSAQEIIQITDYFIEKIESPDKNEVNLDELLDRRNL